MEPESLVSESAVDLLADGLGNERESPCECELVDDDHFAVQDGLSGSHVTPFRATRFYYDRAKASGYFEQLWRTVNPSLDELHSPGSRDTGGERNDTVLTGLQHKYPQTALLLVTDKCFSYCRFCFRKRFVGVTSSEVAVDFPAIAEYLWQHPEICNVLISGGDPFTLSTARIHNILDHLLPIPHLSTIRFGTRAVVYYPKRFNDRELPALFERVLEAGKAAVVVAHVNHVGEVSSEMENAVQMLRSIGVQWFSQTVLLNRVNADAEVLERTFRSVCRLGVRPYYLFQARPVRQASHFQVSLAQGVELVRQVSARLSGLEKVFRFVMSHATGKIEILDLADDGRLYMRYHQATDPTRVGRVFSRPYRVGACWLDDLSDDAKEPS